LLCGCSLAVVSAIGLLLLGVVLLGYTPDVSAEDAYRTMKSTSSQLWHFNELDTCGQTPRCVHLRRWKSPGGREHSVLTIVCLHGTFSSSHEFDYWAAALEKIALAANDQPVDILAVDLPGHGLTGPWEDPHGMQPYSIDADVAFLKQLMEQPELAGKKVVLVGHSLGGAVAARFAALYPARVAGVSLLAPWGLRHGEKDPCTQHCVWFVKFAISPRWRFLSLWLCLLMVHFTPKPLVHYALSTAFGPSGRDGQLDRATNQIGTAASKM